MKTYNIHFLCIFLAGTLILITTFNSNAENCKEPVIANISDNINDWQFTDPKAWTLSKDEEGNSVLCLNESSNYEPPVRSPKSIALIKDKEWENFTLVIQAKQTGKEYGHRDLCFFFGYQDPSHFYYVHIATKADDHAHSIFLVNGAPRVSIAKDRTQGVDWGNDYHQIKITRNTTTGKIEVFFDDMKKPIMSTEDKTFLKGKIGLGSFDDTGCFKQLKIWNTDNLEKQ